MKAENLWFLWLRLYTLFFYLCLITKLNYKSLLIRNGMCYISATCLSYLPVLSYPHLLSWNVGRRGVPALFRTYSVWGVELLFILLEVQLPPDLLAGPTEIRQTKGWSYGHGLIFYQVHTLSACIPLRSPLCNSLNACSQGYLISQKGEYFLLFVLMSFIPCTYLLNQILSHLGDILFFKKKMYYFTIVVFHIF